MKVNRQITCFIVHTHPPTHPHTHTRTHTHSHTPHTHTHTHTHTPHTQHTHTHTYPAKSVPSGKPTRKRKPTQKIVEQQREVKSRKHHHKDTPLKAPPSTTLQASDWETSDEETILPFLDSSLASTEDKLNPDSAGSSWQSSDSDREDPDPSRGDAPDFRVNPLTPNVANRLLSSSSTPSFMNEPPDNNTSNFLPQTPTGGSSNFLPETPTVTTPTFMADISMEDESDVLSQQLMEGSGGEHGKWLTSSGSASSDSD